jgi:hypothetical protein
MKNVISVSKIFKITDLEGFEITNIIVAASSLRINDREFIEKLIGQLEKQLEKLDKDDLMNLARCFIVYVKQFEGFYVKIHN